MKKVFFVSNSGGHLSELLKFESLFEKYEVTLVTEKTDVTDKYKKDYKIKLSMYTSKSKKILYLFSLVVNAFSALGYIIKEKPEIIVTTGACLGGIYAYIAKKLLKSKVIYIESLTRITELSGTGRQVYKFADVFYVQWEELIKTYPKATYIGRIL